MDHFTYKSSAEHIDTPVDCRVLRLSLKFYMLTQEKMLELGHELMRFAYNQFSDCAIFDWFCNGRRNSSERILDSILQTPNANSGLSIGFSAYIRGPRISNVTALREFEKTVQKINPHYAYGWDAGFFESIDYPAFYDGIFSKGKPNNEEILKRIIEIFHEPGKKYYSFHNFSDLGGGFYSHQYHNHPDYYYGTGTIWISAFSIGYAADRIGDVFSAFAQNISEKFIHINASIGVQPFRTNDSPYMRYFGRGVAMDGTHFDNQCSPTEWYPYYYFGDIAWTNIISPLTKRLLESSSESICSDGCTIKTLNSGALLVTAPRSLLDFDVNTAQSVKNIIVDALYPGISTVPLRALFPSQGKELIYWDCPRSDWAILPVEEAEIRIVGTDLLYISRNYMTYE